jgi:DNA (cytosine-5)-methyltransferase 1
MPLALAVKMWPTPKANEPGMSAKTSGRHFTKSTHLTMQVAIAEGMINPSSGRMWPTPTAHNAKETNAPSEALRNTPILAAQVGGSLNPTWVEWLMGFPIGFAVSKDWVMPKYRCKPQPPTDCLEVTNG